MKKEDERKRFLSKTLPAPPPPASSTGSEKKSGGLALATLARAVLTEEERQCLVAWDDSRSLWHAATSEQRLGPLSNSYKAALQTVLATLDGLEERLGAEVGLRLVVAYFLAGRDEICDGWLREKLLERLSGRAGGGDRGGSSGT